MLYKQVVELSNGKFPNHDYCIHIVMMFNYIMIMTILKEICAHEVTKLASTKL